MPEPLTAGCPLCPLCDEGPLWVLGGGTQAFCGNDACPVLTWNPTKSRDENLLNMRATQWEPTEGTDERMPE